MKKKISFILLLTFMFSLSFGSFNSCAVDETTEIWEVKETDDPIKKWNIKFSHDLDFSTVNNYTIYIEDEFGNMIEVEVDKGKDEKTVLISPINPYDSNRTYYIFITNKIGSMSKLELTSLYKIPFIYQPKNEDSQIISFPAIINRGICRRGKI